MRLGLIEAFNVLNLLALNIGYPRRMRLGLIEATRQLLLG